MLPVEQVADHPSCAAGRSEPARGRLYSDNQDENPAKVIDAEQIVFGLLCTSTGCPVAVEIFEGSTADPNTVASQVDKLRQRFGSSAWYWSATGAC